MPTRTTTFSYTTTAGDSHVLASKGTASKMVVLTESLGFMSMDYQLRIFSKIPFLPLWHSRIVETWFDDRQKATDGFSTFKL